MGLKIDRRIEASGILGLYGVLTGVALVAFTGGNTSCRKFPKDGKLASHGPCRYSMHRGGKRFCHTAPLHETACTLVPVLCCDVGVPGSASTI